LATDSISEPAPGAGLALSLALSLFLIASDGRQNIKMKTTKCIENYLLATSCHRENEVC